MSRAVKPNYRGCRIWLQTWWQTGRWNWQRRPCNTRRPGEVWHP